MRYPIRKHMALACLAIASLGFAPKPIPDNSETSNPAIASPMVIPVTATTTPLPLPAPMPAIAAINSSAELYNDLQLGSNGMKPEVLQSALTGYSKLSAEGKIENEDKITIIDFSQPSNQKRLYVIDLTKKRLLFQSLVAHGRGTGTLWAESFSNTPSSYKSSPGFYVTGQTYRGHNGYSLRLDGLEKDINDNAADRAIVVHGAPYVSDATIRSLGFLGRSEGCPALPTRLAKPIINTIKNGTCLFIYTPSSSYLNYSGLLGESSTALN